MSVQTCAPLRVLHLIDGLGGGGSERWVWDIVRLSDREQVRHLVVPLQPDLGRFVYADRLRAAGALDGRSAGTADSASRSGRPRGAALVHLDETLVPEALRACARPLYWTCVSPYSFSRMLLAFRRFRPDVIHGHTFHGFAFSLALKRLTRRPLVHTVPSRFAHMSDAGYGWMVTAYRRYHTAVDRFVTGYPAELRSIGIPGDRMVVLPSSGDTESVDATLRNRDEHRARLRRALGMPADSPLLLSVGRLHSSKGHDCAAAAVARVRQSSPNVHWVVLGDGPERAALERLVATLGLRDCAHLVGFCEDPGPWYAAADVYLRTNVLEADNLSSVDAMAFGLPVAGFETGGETELVHKVGHGVLVANRNAAALARAVRWLLEQPERGRHIGQRGAIYVRRYADLRSTIEGFVDTYYAVAPRHREPAARTFEPAKPAPFRPETFEGP
jgi:glycosyltransferase involved in cell wall biosynthesis